MRFGSERSRFEQVFGVLFFVIAAAFVLGTTAFFMTLPTARRDALTYFGVAALLLIAAASGSIGTYLTSTSKRGQELGCFGAMFFSMPLGLIVMFLLWSLFQTTRAAP